MLCPNMFYYESPITRSQVEDASAGTVTPMDSSEGPFSLGSVPVNRVSGGHGWGPTELGRLSLLLPLNVCGCRDDPT